MKTMSGLSLVVKAPTRFYLITREEMGLSSGGLWSLAVRVWEEHHRHGLSLRLMLRAVAPTCPKVTLSGLPTVRSRASLCNEEEFGEFRYSDSQCKAIP